MMISFLSTFFLKYIDPFVLVQVESNGNYHITSSNGGSFAVGQDGTVLFNAKSDFASTHIIRQKSQAILEVIEPDGMTTIQVQGQFLDELINEGHVPIPTQWVEADQMSTPSDLERSTSLS